MSGENVLCDFHTTPYLTLIPEHETARAIQSSPGTITRYKLPKKRPKFSSKAIRTRDQNRCQYTGRFLAPGEGSLDHVLPLSRGGANSFENVVLAHKEVNNRKADRTPEEAGLRLLSTPKTPREVPVTLLIRNPGIRDWAHFLPE